jgi:hypothetical protein
MLGHQDIATTLRYARTELEDVRSMMEAEETAQISRKAGHAEAEIVSNNNAIRAKR